MLEIGVVNQNMHIMYNFINNIWKHEIFDTLMVSGKQVIA